MPEGWIAISVLSSDPIAPAGLGEEALAFLEEKNPAFTREYIDVMSASFPPLQVDMHFCPTCREKGFDWLALFEEERKKVLFRNMEQQAAGSVLAFPGSP
jgi:hypothetical protein